MASENQQHKVELEDLIAAAQSLLGDAVHQVAVHRAMKRALAARGMDASAAEAFAFKVVRAAGSEVDRTRKILVVATSELTSSLGRVLAVFADTRLQSAEHKANAYIRDNPHLFIALAPFDTVVGAIVPVPCARCGRVPRIISHNAGSAEGYMVRSGCGEYAWARGTYA